MGKDIGIYMSLVDKVSPGLSTISNSNKAFNKSLQETEQRVSAYSKRLGTLTKDSASLKTAIAAGTEEVKEAQKAYRKYGDEISKNNLNAAIEKQTNLKNQLKDTEYTIRNTQKAFHGYTEEVRKAGNAGDSSLAAGLKTAGIYKMLGDSFSQLSGTMIQSALGQPTASFVSSIFSGIGQGAAMGSLTGTITGTAIGAAVGGVSGVMSGAAQVYGAQDEAFKSYVQDAYDTVKEEQSTSLSSGSETAAGRETTKLSFTTLFGGEAAADSYLSSLREFAAETPFEYDTLTDLSKTLKTFGYAVDDMIPTLTKVGDAGAALGLSTSDVSTVATYIGRMKSSDKATLEYLNPLNERGFSVFQWIADDLDTTIADVYNKISSSELSGTYVSDLILKQFEGLYGGMMEVQSQTFGGLSSTLADAQTELDNARGEGYNDKRKEGIQSEIDYLSGDNGERMKEAYNAIGAWEADLENQKEQYIRDAKNAIMASDEYLAAEREGDALAMGRMLKMAEVQGMNDFNASPDAQLALQADLDLAKSIQEDTASDTAYWDAGYQKGQQFTKGLTNGILSFNRRNVTVGFSGYDEGGNSLGSGNTSAFDVSPSSFSSHAYGLQRVPYDNFPALLHENEQVLTASEARNYDKGSGGVKITITGNTFGSNVGPEEIARELTKQINRAFMLSVPQ